MKKILIVPAIILSGTAILLAVRVGQWKVVSRGVGSSWEAMFETHLSPPGTLAIVRRPPPADFHRGPLESLPVYSPIAARKSWQVDLRGYDLSRLEVSNRLADLLHADFDSKTRWPTNLPAGFDPARIMQLGKDPGLGVRKLHAGGITGKGKSIGIIDQTLLVDHMEYGERLQLYEEVHNFRGSEKNGYGKGEAQMHGPAVASVAVGKTVGVAPEADLYYIACNVGGGPSMFDWDFTWLAKSINRLLDINATLPTQNRIRVISISVGWMPLQAGYAEVTAAAKRAKQEGVFVISTVLNDTHGLFFHGLGREPIADPNAFTSYSPGTWWAQVFWSDTQRFTAGERLLVPMDSRCTASPTGPEDYVFYREGGWSWCVPWIAGLYALACEVKPDITPEQFWSLAIKTGRTLTVKHEGKEYTLGPIVNPEALISSLAGH